MKSQTSLGNRIFEIIEYLAKQENGVGITQIAAALGLAKSTVHRILSGLLAQNYVAKNNASGKYTLGYKFIAIAGEYLNRLDLRSAGSPFVIRLAKELGVTSHIAILRDNTAMYIEKIEAYTSFCSYSAIGKTIRLYCSSLGKALLLGFSDKEFEEYIANTVFEKITPATISKEELIKEIKEARWSLITYDRAEHEEEVYCLGAPIFDYSGKVIAAISISTTNKALVTKERYSSALLSTAKQYSTLFGGEKYFLRR